MVAQIILEGGAEYTIRLGTKYLTSPITSPYTNDNILVRTSPRRSCRRP